jgi:GNAT superfamily N-acetyltransferase
MLGMPGASSTNNLRRRWRRMRKKHGPEILYTYVLSRPGANPLADRPGFALVPVTASNLEEFRRAYPKEQSERKHRIMSARIGHPVESSWLIQGPDGEWCGYCHVAWSDNLNARIGHLVELAADEAYFFDDYVVKKHRGKGLQAFSIAARFDIAAARGVTRARTTITKGNHPSVASYAKFDLVRTGMLIAFPSRRRTIAVPLPARPVRTAS